MLQFGYKINTATVTLPVSYTSYYSVAFGIVYNKGQYGYDAVKAKTITGFTFYDHCSGLGQMWISCGI